ncbi:MAG: PepSY domain-containing protein [Clostridia bacterium]|nr:PepSY domain-containing protein [Clostridia bacterium]
MKKLIATVLSLIFVISLCGCGVVTTPKKNITREQAISIALESAKLDEKDIKNLETDLDLDEKLPQWEITFDILDYEYSYDIDAYTGEIINAEKDKD